MAAVDYYRILGLSSSATDDEIKMAYRRLVKLYHPDTNQDPEASLRFREIYAAYAVLSDPVKRSEYDKKNHKNASNKAAAPPERHFASPHGSGAASAIIYLKPMLYALSAQEVSLLHQQGILRGVAPQAENQAYYCHRCQHPWTAPGPSHLQIHTHGLPDACPRCHARDWGEFLLLRCRYCAAIFEREGAIREQKGEDQEGRLFSPYELFSRCPSCKKSRWCLGEEERLVAERKANRQAATHEKERWFASREKVRRDVLQEEAYRQAAQQERERLAKALQEEALRQSMAQQKEVGRQEERNPVDPLQPSSTDFDEYEPFQLPYQPYEG